MEGDTVRLQGEESVKNEVLHVFKDHLISALQTSENGGASSDDSVEVISAGTGSKKRGRSFPAESSSKGKKPRHPTTLHVLALRLSFPAPNDSAELSAALSSSPSASHPNALCPVYLQSARDSAKTPHRLYLRAYTSDRALVELDPLDPSLAGLTSTWTQMIAPLPLTAAGKPFKKGKGMGARMAKAVKKGEPRAVCPTGAGGLLDALALLDGADGEGVSLDLRFSAEPIPAGEGEEGGGVNFHLAVDVRIAPDEFFTAHYSRSKRILVDRLLPPGETPGAPKEAGIDFFYASLERAPRTVGGLPMPRSASSSAAAASAAGAAMDVDGDEPEEEDDEARAARLRREAKGKMRAVSPPPPASAPAPVQAYEGPEDEPLHPAGLTVELMPFQARTVRWMLGRERKRVLPRAREDEDGDAMHEDDAEEEEEEGKDKPPPVLADVSQERKRDMRRGPLWEVARLRVLPPSAAMGEEDEAEAEAEAQVEERPVWLNRVSLQLREGDPLGPGGEQGEAEGDAEVDEDGDVVVLPATSTRTSRSKGKGKAKGTAKAAVKVEVSEEAEADGGDEGTRSSKKVVGGEEGHGLLAEEVGLGKTVEVLSLILLHKDPKRHRLPAYKNPVTDSDVQPTGLTLVIAPAAIVGQWQSEIERLTPGLRVLRYEGLKSLTDKQTASVIAKKYDILLTTFDVLRKEVAFARKPVQKGLRNKREVRYRRSLLVEIDFLRIIMDEAQMVGDAVGPTSETASLISRRFSWAVTSTPLRDKIADLKPLLTYLRVEPVASGRTGLQRLLEEVGSFKRLFNEIGARTLKSQVTHELTLPQQVRMIVPIDFTAVEKFYYDQRVSEMLRSIGLSAEGVPLNTGVDRDTGEALPWTPDTAEMNRWLTILRQLAVHPQLGGNNREQFGRVLRTVDEVLEHMREQHVSQIQSDQRALLAARTRRGQYQMWQKDVEDRFAPALEIFKGVVEQIDPLIEEVATEIHKVYREKKKDKGRSPSADPADEGLAGALELGFRSKEAETHDANMMSEKDRAVARALGALRNRLRDLLFVKHSALFFSGHANYNMKHEEEEKAMYAKAEELRQTILQPYESAVESAQATLKTQLEARDDADGELDVGDFEIQFNEKGHGLRGIRVFDEIEATSDVANGFAELIFQYRDLIKQMVLKSVSISGEEATGEEYEERAMLQEKLTVYADAYTVLLNEWNYILTGSQSAHALQLKAEMMAALHRQEVIPAGAPPPGGVEPDAPVEDVDEALQDAVQAIAGPSLVKDMKGGKKKKEKQQKTRYMQKRSANVKNLSLHEFIAPTLESGATPADILRYELLKEIIESKGEEREHYQPQPLRQLIKQLKETADTSEDDREIAILEREQKRLTKQIGPLEKINDRLRAELAETTKVFNARIAYYGQLQEISDEVADPDMTSSKWLGLENEIASLREDELELETAIIAKEGRRRYLDNLNDPTARDQAERECPICAEFFEDGILTNCAHLTCAACFRRWHSTSRTCALCKAPLPAGTYQTVKYRARLPPVPVDEDEEPAAAYIDSNGVSHAFDLPVPELSRLEDHELDRIREVDTAEPLSSKSDFIAKHVKYIRRRDPEAKIVIFSAWQEALTLLMEAFNRNGVKYVRLEGATGKGKKEGVVARFQEDPDVAAFFLHTRSQSAGLNLTVARYVFLVEPLLQPSLELQAVARVHRIGQRFQTIVHQYVVTDTADEKVAELRARHGTSLFLADAQADGAKESLLGQKKDRASAEARKAAKTTDAGEAIDDETDIARCLLSSEAFINLQRSLLPSRLRDQAPLVTPAQQPAVHDKNQAHQPAAMAGIAAAGRAAFVAEEEWLADEANAPVAGGSGQA
ncbi:hypothetical protein JCM10213_003100 [Rhodosporidiobolus nylandii]